MQEKLVISFNSPILKALNDMEKAGVWPRWEFWGVEVEGEEGVFLKVSQVSKLMLIMTKTTVKIQNIWLKFLPDRRY